MVYICCSRLSYDTKTVDLLNDIRASCLEDDLTKYQGTGKIG